MSAADNYVGPGRRINRGPWRGAESLRSGRIDFSPAPAGSVEARAAALASVSLVCSCGWRGKAAQLGDEGCPRCESDDGLARGDA